MICALFYQINVPTIIILTCKFKYPQQILFSQKSVLFEISTHSFWKILNPIPIGNVMSWVAILVCPIWAHLIMTIDLVAKCGTEIDRNALMHKIW